MLSVRSPPEPQRNAIVVLSLHHNSDHSEITRIMGSPRFGNGNLELDF